MSIDPTGDRAARGTALRGAAVGLALAAALLVPAALAGRVPARGDLADFFWPMKAYTAARWAAGAIPLWNPLSACGEPWLAQLQSGVLYPGDAPFLLGWKEGALLGIALHLALAAAGAARWLDDLGASRTASLAAAGLYAGGGAFLSLFPVYNNACSAAWLPWIFLGARRIVLGRARGAGFAVAVAGAFLAGEPAIAAAGTLAAVALSLWTGAEGEAPGARRPTAEASVRLVVPLLLGLCLAGAALLPFGELVRGAQRRARTTREEAVARAIGPSDLADLVAAPRPEVTRTASSGRGGYLVTLALGPLPLLLAAGAGAGFPGRRRLLAGLAILGGGGLLLAIGTPGLLAPALFDTGLLRGVRFPARWAIFTHLALSVVAAAGLDGWIWGRFRHVPMADGAGAEEADARESSARTRASFVVPGAVGLLLVGTCALAGLVPEARTTRDFGRTVAGGAAAALGLAAIGLARRRAGAGAGGPAVCLAALAVVPLPWLAGEALASVPAAIVSAPSKEVLALPRGPASGRVLAPAGNDRTLALRWRYADSAAWGAATVARAAEALAGYTNLFHGVATTGSASPIGNPRLERLVGVALSGGDVVGLLALLDVRQVLTPFPARAPGLRPEGGRGGVLRYAVPGPFGRAYFPLESRLATDDEAFEAMRRRAVDPERVALVAPPLRGPSLPPARTAGSWAAARFVAETPESAELSTSASTRSLLVLTRSWDPGWVARVDGAPVEVLRAQLAFVAVVVPPGDHRLEIAYRPSSFRAGLWLSAAGLLGVLALAVAGPPGARRR